MINPMNLQGKLILVTGASSGIGKQTALTLSQLGARVICIGRNEEKLKKTISELEGDGHAYYQFDLEKTDEIETLVRRMCSENGQFNGYVHCAGDTITRPLTLNKPEKMVASYEAICFSFVELVRCLTKKDRFSDEGSIVAISSVSAANVHGRKAKVAYSSARAALECTARCLASELAERKIRVNTVEAGLVLTEMASEYLNDNAESEKIKEFDTRQFLGPMEPVEIANVFAFLMSDAAKHITGTAIAVDGGYLQG